MSFQGIIYPASTVLSMADVRLLAANHADLRVWSFSDLTALHWRWYWHDRPGAWLKSGARRLEPGPGEIVLIPPGTPFECGLDAPAGQLYFHFNLPMRRARDRTPLVLPVKAGERAKFARLAAQLRQAEAPGADSGRLRWEVLSLIYQALAALPAETWRGQIRDEAVERAAGYIYARYPAAPTTAELATLVHLSPNTLLRRFRARTGLPPHQFVQQLRIDDACARLHHTQASVEEIAEATGFADRYHFSKVFRRIRGIGPVRFRRAAQGGEGAAGA